MSKIKTTVYIPSNNYGNYLKAAIESVLRQTYNSWELIIINDNSKDNTQEIMELYRWDERIRLFNTDGIGLPAVCNLALKEAKGEYFIRLDADDIFDENILLVLTNYLEHHTNYDMVFPDYFLMDESGKILSHERREKIYHNNHILDTPANGACSLIRTKILKEIGGYREDLGVQDGYDLWNKLVTKTKFMNVNLPLFYYRRHSHNSTNGIKRLIIAKRIIKSDIIKHKLDYFKPLIAVIPTRKKYDFVQDLWKNSINGASLLDISIKKCIASKLFHKIVVASDCPEVKDLLSSYNDERITYFSRHSEETIRSCSIVNTLERISREYDPETNGITVLSYIHTPFVSTATMEEALFTLLINEADSAFGLQEFDYPLYRRHPNGLEAINPRGALNVDLETVYLDSQTSMATRNRNFRGGSLTGSLISNFIVHEDECFVINSPKALRIAQILDSGN